MFTKNAGANPFGADSDEECVGGGEEWGVGGRFGGGGGGRGGFGGDYQPGHPQEVSGYRVSPLQSISGRSDTLDSPQGECKCWSVYVCIISYKTRQIQATTPKDNSFFQEKKKSCLGQDSNPRRSVF